MKKYLVLFLLFLFAAALKNAAISAESECRLKDTTSYKNEIYTGKFACLCQGNTLIDSIDLDFGLHSVGKDSLVYVRVETFNSARLKGTYFTKLILFNGREKIPLSPTLEFYNEHFSSPAIIDSSLYYWGFKEDKVLAVRKSFDEEKCDTMSIAVKGTMITDSPFYFHRPCVHKRGILYALDDGQRFIVNRDIKSIREIIPEKVHDPQKKN